MNVDLDAYREQSLETWEGMSRGWERRNDWMVAVTGSVNEWILARADPQPGETILDLAAGPGDLGFRVAEAMGETGRVLSTDFAPAMVEVARRLGQARGLTNVDHRVLDAERMDLDDDSVDAVVCRWGYMLMADPAAALRETRRVVRDDGRLAFAVWASPERNPWAAIPGMTLVQRGHVPPPEPGAPGIFALADPDRLAALVTGAGFGAPEIEEISFDFGYSDADDLWDALVSLAGPLAAVINALPDDERTATREAVLENMGEYRNADGTYSPPALCLGVFAH
jgi:SAM-dependent methyltransferase